MCAMRLNDLCQVMFPTEPVAGDTFYFNGTNWVNRPAGATVTMEQIQNVATTPPTDKQVLMYDADAQKYVPTTIPTSLATLPGVTLGTPADGQVLAYNAATGQFIPTTPAAGGGAASPVAAWSVPGGVNTAKIEPSNTVTGASYRVTFGQCQLDDDVYRSYQTGMAVEVLSHDNSYPVPASSGLEVFRRVSTGGADRVSLIAQYGEADNSGMYVYVIDRTGGTEMSCVEFALTPENNWLAPDAATSGFLGYHLNQSGNPFNGKYSIFVPSGACYFGGTAKFVGNTTFLGTQTGTFPDYVFEEGYSLMPLDELQKFTRENRHLPGIPEAAEVRDQGFDLVTMIKGMLEKIEEQTLYIFGLHDRIARLEAANGI